jgi:hypothetical protein
LAKKAPDENRKREQVAERDQPIVLSGQTLATRHCAQKHHSAKNGKRREQNPGHGSAGQGSQKAEGERVGDDGTEVSDGVDGPDGSRQANLMTP